MVIVCGEYPVIVQSSRCSIVVQMCRRGSLVFIASDFLATFFRVLMYLVVFSPSVKSISDGCILRFGVMFFCVLEKSTFSEFWLSESSCTSWLLSIVPLERGFWGDGILCWSSGMSTSSSLFLYRMSSSSSELPSLLQISSIVGVFCDSSFLSKHLLFRFFYVRLCFDGFVVILEISVFGFRQSGLQTKLFLLWSLVLVWCFQWYFLNLLFTSWGLCRTLLIGFLLFVLTVWPCLFLRGLQLVQEFILYFCFCRTVRIPLLWTLVLDRILLNLVCHEVYSNFLDNLLLYFYHSCCMFLGGGIAIVYLRLLGYSCFVRCFWMEWVLRNPFGFTRLVLLIDLMCLNFFLELWVLSFYICRCNARNFVLAPLFHCECGDTTQVGPMRAFPILLDVCCVLFAILEDVILKELPICCRTRDNQLVLPEISAYPVKYRISFFQR